MCVCVHVCVHVCVYACVDKSAFLLLELLNTGMIPSSFLQANVIFLAIALFIMLRLTYRKAFIQDELSTWKASRRLLR